MANRHKDPDYHKNYYLANKQKFLDKAAAWKIENPDKVVESNKRRYKKKKDEILSKCKEYYENNKETALRVRREWRKANPEKLKEYNKVHGARRRTRVRNACPEWVRTEELLGFYSMAERLTKCLGIPHEVDHYYPLKGKNISGLHVPANLVVIPKHINLRKANKLPEEFYT